MSNEILKQQFRFYLEHQDDLVKQYDGKFLIIKDCQVVAEYNDELEAYRDSLKRFEPGTYIIQKCTAGADDYTQHFHSRVAFA